MVLIFKNQLYSCYDSSEKAYSCPLLAKVGFDAYKWIQKHERGKSLAKGQLQIFGFRNFRCRLQIPTLRLAGRRASFGNGKR